MTRNEWLELTVLERKKYNCLLELEDTTRQLAEALDRNDQVAAKMLVAMRQDPLLKLEEVDRGEKQRKATLPQELMLSHPSFRHGAVPCLCLHLCYFVFVPKATQMTNTPRRLRLIYNYSCP